MSKKNDLEHTSTMLGSQNMKSSQRMVSVVEPYELPEGWKWCRLGDVGETLTGSTPSKKKTEYYGGEFPFFKPADLEQGINLFQSSEYLSAEGKKVSRIVPAKSTLICCIGSIGKSGYSLREGTTNQQINAIIPHKYIDSKYVFYAVNTEDFINQLWSKASSTTISIVNKSKMDNCIIPLPPTLAEQQRIVNRIESMFAKLDEAKEKAQNVVDGFETRKAAILHKAFTGELKIENEKLKEEDWEETTLSECCKLGSGGTPSKSHPEYYENGDIPWLKTGEIDWNDIYDAEEKITDDGVANSSAKMFPAESVVVAMYGMGVTRGRAAIIKKPMTTNQAVCVLQPKEKLYNKFLFYYFMCNYHKIREQSVGGNQLNLSGKIIGNFPIKLPPFNFQLSIVNFLDIIIEKENKAKQAAEAVLEQIDLLKKSILARAFRGEL